MSGPVVSPSPGHSRRDNGPCRLESWVGCSHGPELIEDNLEASEVGLAPIAARAFALFDYLLDSGSRTGQIDDGDQLRPRECGSGDLGLGRADKAS